MLTLSELTSRHAHAGKVEWISIRPERRADPISVATAKIIEGGLAGDHYSGTGKRSVTLIQYEHLPVIASFLKQTRIDPALLRRNIVVSGINLLALRNSHFRIGDSILKGTRICAPCSRMEEAFGHGGYKAVRGHGGITASVDAEGEIELNDQVLKLTSA